MEKNLADSVSIIVPIYHGKKYISKLVEMAEVCKEKAGVQVKVELILSNDDPDACIEDGYFSELVDIRVLNTEGSREPGSGGLRHQKERISFFLTRTISYFRIISAAS